MKNYGLIRVAAAVPVVKLADVVSNRKEICSLIDKAEAAGASVLVFPELSLTGASCGDLFGQETLLKTAEKAVSDIKVHTRGKLVTVFVGVPVRYLGRLYDCAAVIRNGVVKGLVPKAGISASGDTAQHRWFASGPVKGELDYAGSEVCIGPDQIFKIGGVMTAVAFADELAAPVPSSSFQALAGAQLIVSMASENDVMSRHQNRKILLAAQSVRTHTAYVYCGAGHGESTQDKVCSGEVMIFEDGDLQAAGRRFMMGPQLVVTDIDIEKLEAVRQKDCFFSAGRIGGQESCYTYMNMGEAADTDFEAALYRPVDCRPFIPKDSSTGAEAEAVDIQVAGLAARLEHIGCKKVILGISGGLDSTLALLVSVLAFDRLGWDRKGILGVTMPGFGTSDRTYTNALDFMEALGISQREISIVPAVKQHFNDIGQDINVHDVTYENSQARERTQILMDIANKEKGIVVGTGDLSELALGWATYNGDHMSMYGVNASVPKTLVRHLVLWISDHHFQECSGSGRSAASILKDIVDTPVSPELTPAAEDGKIAQKTEDLVGPYELHDFYLYNHFKYGFGPEKIFFLALKAFDGKEGRPEYDRETIKKCLRTFFWRFFTQQFKRSCLPDGPKVTEISLSPRGDWMMPSDAKMNLYAAELDNLQ